MNKTLSELQGLVNTTVMVEFTSPSGETEKANGKLLRVAGHGIVFESKGRTAIIPLSALIDISPFATPRNKVVRRKVQHLQERRARQHLLDRHGFLWDLIRFISEKTAFTMHDKIDHSNLGHQHRAQGDATPDEEVEE